MEFTRYNSPKHSRNRYYKYVNDGSSSSFSNGNTTNVYYEGSTSSEYIHPSSIELESVSSNTANITSLSATNASILQDIEVDGTLTVYDDNGIGSRFLSDLEVDGTLTTKSIAELESGAHCGGNLTMTATDAWLINSGTTHLNKALTVNDNTAIQGKLNVTGDTTLNKLIANDDATLHKNLKVDGDTIIDGTLVVNDEFGIGSQIGGDVEIDGTLTTKSIAELESGAHCDGNIGTTAFDADIMTGNGWRIDNQGNGVLESLVLRSFLEVPELRYNRVTVESGTQWNAAGAGIILKVDTTNRQIYLKLEEGEIGSFDTGDICMGIWHFQDEPYSEITTSDEYTQAKKDGIAVDGFVRVYFTVDEDSMPSDYYINAEGDTKTETQYEALSPTKKQEYTVRKNGIVDYTLRYQLDSTWAITAPPMAQMTVVAYGNFVNTARQTSAYSTRTFKRYLFGVNDWQIKPQNIALQLGDLSNLTINGKSYSGYSAYLNNIYMEGTIKQLSEHGEELKQLNYKGQWNSAIQYYTNDEVYCTYNNSTSLYVCNQDNINVPPYAPTPIWTSISGGKGDQGVQGNDGKILRMRGEWNNYTTYYNNSTYRDVVLYDGDTFIVKTTNQGYLPTNTTYYEPFNQFENVATSVLLADNGYINILGTQSLFIGTSASNGWRATNGAITHTQSNLSLTSDGKLSIPNGTLSFKVGNKTYNDIGTAIEDNTEDSVTEEELLETGIDIENKLITLTSNQLKIVNNSGVTNVWVDSEGNLVTRGIQQALTTQIKDASSWASKVHKGTVKTSEYYVLNTDRLDEFEVNPTDDGFENVNSLDILCCGDNIDITYTQDGTHLFLPTICADEDNEYYYKTLTKNQTNTVHPISFAEVRQLIGRKVNIYNNSNNTITLFTGIIPRHKTISQNVKTSTNTDTTVYWRYEDSETYNGELYTIHDENADGLHISRGARVTLEFKSVQVEHSDNHFSTNFVWDIISYDNNYYGSIGNVFSEDSWNAL